MVFASFKNKIVSLAGSVINQVVCSAVSLSSSVKVAPDVLLSASSFKPYGFLQDVYYPRFQLAKDNDYCIMEELGKFPVRVEYKSENKFSSAKEAKAAMAYDLLEARWCPLSRKADSPPLSENASPSQQDPANSHIDEQCYDLVEYPEHADYVASTLASGPNQETGISIKKKKAFKFVKSKLLRFSQVICYKYV